MIKKYLVAVDTNIDRNHINEVRTFMFSKTNIYDTIEEAEKNIERWLKEDLSGQHQPVLYTIIPIYTK